MGHPRVTLGVLFLVSGLAGCGSQAAKSDAGHPLADASRDTTIPIHLPTDAAVSDALVADSGAACACTMDGTTLHMTWPCFCEAYGCSAATNTTTCGPLLTWASACGLRVRTWTSTGGLNTEIFDATGALVGVRLSGHYACHGAADGGATVILESGQFPPATCQTMPCDCNLDGTIDCPSPDGG